MTTFPTSSPGLGTSVRQLARSGLATIPVGVWGHLAPKDIIALCYHLVSDEELPHQVLYAFKTSAQFERDIEYIGSRAIGYEEASALRRHEVRLPANRFLVTFDDGFSQCFDVVRPILSRHNVPGVFFVNIDFMEGKRPFFESRMSSCLRAVADLEGERAAEILARLRADPGAGVGAGAAGTMPGRGRALERLRSARIRLPATEAHLALALWLLGFEEDEHEELAEAAEILGVPAGVDGGAPAFMTADQARQLVAEGFTLGSHGLTHLPMQRLGPEDLERQVVESCSTIRDLSGQERVPFAFPYSAHGIDRSLLAEIRRRHPFVDLVFDTEAFKRDAPFMVQRLAADLPPAPGDGPSNIPSILRAAWSRRSAWYRDHMNAPDSPWSQPR
jgi:peptidoglycan/xylan/chitin deacetylase (PgdA/CDA1 family)